MVIAPWRGLTVIALGVTLLLGGCAPTETIDDEESAMDFEEARSELAGLLDQAQAVIGGEWESTEFGARSCTTASGESGAQLMVQRLGPPVADGSQREIAGSIAAIFTNAGFEARTSDSHTGDGLLVIQGHYPGDGTDSEGFGLDFGVSPNGSTLGGMSRCTPGDANQINHDRQESEGD